MHPNIISSHVSSPGIAFFNSSTTTVQGNYIGTNLSGEEAAGFDNDTVGIALIANSDDNLIGGTASGAGNLIRGNGGGIAVFSIQTNEAEDNTIIGNTIYSNSGGPITTLGIDLMDDTDGNFSPDAELGVTPNDGNDVDTGTNDYLNFPALNSSSANAGSLDVNFNLDIPNTNVGVTGYRVEFFANTTADASGNGEGEIYLGSKVVSSDVTGEVATLTISQSFASGSYAITATTTEIDGSTDGFGATSEFAGNLNNQTITAAAGVSSTSSSLANTGKNTELYFTVSVILILSSTIYLNRRFNI